ncbi:MAG: hypothetical protein ABL977_08955 [Candidatus Eisenbacteria bacterium]
MGHSYTPGLRVTADTVVRRERRLPLRGEVLASPGQAVGPDHVVARAELPGNVQTLNLASRLGVDPAQVTQALVRPVGSTVRRGEVVAISKAMFGLMKNQAESPADGVIENVSTVTGQLLLREPPIPVEVTAYVRGVVAEVLPGEGVVIESRGALVQGIFGVGGETYGPLVIATASPGDALESAHLRAGHRGAVVVGGRHVSHATVQRARELGVAALIVGGFDDQDLRQLLGRDLGVAITGQESLGITLVLTEGFGHIEMAQRTWQLLQANRGRVASVSGATQIRAGVLRPEVLIPGDGVLGGAAAGEAQSGGSLELGSVVRVIRQPWFGRLGRVIELPSELRPLDTEAMVRVLVVEFADDGTRAMVPRANVERIAG